MLVYFVRLFKKWGFMTLKFFRLLRRVSTRESGTENILIPSGAVELEQVWSSTLLTMSTKRSKLSIVNVPMYFKFKTELYHQHSEQRTQAMVDKKKIEQEKGSISTALCISSEDISLSLNEATTSSDTEA